MQLKTVVEFTYRGPLSTWYANTPYHNLKLKKCVFNNNLATKEGEEFFIENLPLH